MRNLMTAIFFILIILPIKVMAAPTSGGPLAPLTQSIHTLLSFPF